MGIWIVTNRLTGEFIAAFSDVNRIPDEYMDNDEQFAIREYEVNIKLKD